MMFEQLGIEVITGCPELEIQEIIETFMQKTLVTGINSCGHGEGHVCHGHEEGHHCSHHH